ncbi:MAG: class I SAM-dependent methyltransferase [Candidatus Hydrogenedentes bacterium]|nr:class I SAM-dependent methyltransferase [Candidatus Hydrogenedentota bacterium]
MNDLIRQIYETGVVEDRDGRKYDVFPSSISRADGEAIYRVVRDSGAVRTLETGMAYGLSSLFMLQAVKDNGGTQHVSMDPYQAAWWHNVGLANVERAGFAANHRFFAAPSYNAMPELLKAGERFDAIFIDGNHRFEYSLIDFIFGDQLLNKGGCLILHDPWMPSIRKAISFIVRNRDESYQIVPEYGIGADTRWRASMKFLKALRENPYDLFAARFFARKTLRNYCVFRKIRSISQEDIDRAWDVYCSF